MGKIQLTEDELRYVIENATINVVNEGGVKGIFNAAKAGIRGAKAARATRQATKAVNNVAKARTAFVDAQKAAEKATGRFGKNIANYKVANAGERVNQAIIKSGKISKQEFKEFRNLQSLKNSNKLTDPQQIQRYNELTKKMRSAGMKYSNARNLTRQQGNRQIAGLVGAGAAIGGAYAIGRNSGGKGNTSNDNVAGNNIVDNGNHETNAPVGGYPWDGIKPVIEKPIKKQPTTQVNNQKTNNKGEISGDNKLQDMSATAAGKIIRDKLNAEAMPQMQTQDKIGVPHAQARSTVNNANISRRQAQGQSPERIGNAAIRQQGRTLRNQEKINETN